jgi:hypothetical protein
MKPILITRTVRLLRHQLLYFFKLVLVDILHFYPKRPNQGSHADIKRDPNGKRQGGKDVAAALST